jgi:hypothetical protein
LENILNVLFLPSQGEREKKKKKKKKKGIDRVERQGRRFTGESWTKADFVWLVVT